MTLAVSPGTTGVWLAAIEARAHARGDDTHATRRALDQVPCHRDQSANNRTGEYDMDGIGGILTFGEPKQRYYAATALRRVGQMSTLQGLLSTNPRGLNQNVNQWLTDRVGCLLEKAATLQYPLGIGLIHADLYSGNMIYDSSRPSRPWPLGDWDSVCIGPREIDLVLIAAAPRFGLDEPSVTTFAYAYGVREWDGVEVLWQIRELSTLPALIRLADTNADSAKELDHRIDSLQRGDTTVRWHRQ